MMRLLITGATGVAGLNIYRAALEDTSISAITLLQRREMPSWAVLPSNAAEKTTTIVHSDFAVYTPELAARLAQHDACIWAMGKSVRGMTEAEYTVLTHDYPMAFLEALRDAGAGRDRPADRPFRFLYISGEGADASEKGMQMWARVKGRTENDTIKFCHDEPGMQAHVLRPGYFRPLRKYPADWANQRTSFESGLDCVLGPVLSTITPSLVLPIDAFGRATLGIAQGKCPEQELFKNKDMLKIAKDL